MGDDVPGLERNLNPGSPQHAAVEPTMLMPPHRCANCGRLVTGACRSCRASRDRSRPNANSRGYCSAAWRRFRAIQLDVSPLCVRCLLEGRTTAATDVDHVQPVAGPTDPRFLDFSAVQSLCRRHHSQKTATDDSMFGKVR